MAFEQVYAAHPNGQRTEVSYAGGTLAWGSRFAWRVSLSSVRRRLVPCLSAITKSLSIPRKLSGARFVVCVAAGKLKLHLAVAKARGPENER